MLAALLLANAGCERQRHPEPPRPLPDRQPAVAEPVRPVTPGAELLTLKTRQVSSAQLSASPDGKFLVFSALGQLFRVSTKGGNTEQLTFGAHFDDSPSVAPEGGRVAFTSDRDPKAVSSLHLLNLSTGQVDQVVDDEWVSAPAWSPDGKKLGYLSCSRSILAPRATRSCRVREVELASKQVSTLTDSGPIVALTYLDGGRLVWSRLELDAQGTPASSELLSRNAKGTASVQLHTQSIVQRLAPGPSKNSALVVKRAATGAASTSTLEVVTLPGGSPELVAQLSLQTPPGRPSLARGQVWLSERGALWHVDLETRAKTALPLTLEAKLEAFPRSASAHKPQANRAGGLSYPRVLAGGDLLFVARGQLWRQRAGEAQAARLLSGEGEPFVLGAAASPNGKRLAYQWSHEDSHELRLTTLASTGSKGKKGGAAPSTVTVSKRTTGQAFDAAWHPESQRLAFAEYAGEEAQVVVVDLVLGKRLKLDTSGTQAPGTHFSADGQWLYFSARGQVQRVSSSKLTAPEPITALERPFQHARVSPDGKWLLFLRGNQLFRAALGSKPINERAAQLWAKRVTEGFSFVPDGTQLVYADVSGKLWQRPLSGAAAKPLAAKLPAPSKAPPLLVRNVRPLDPAGQRFLEPASILIDQGRIQWIGKLERHEPPPETIVLDGQGRYAIPGLFDMHAQLSHPDLAPSWRMTRADAFVSLGITAIANRGARDPVVHNWQARGSQLLGPVPRILSVETSIETDVFFSAPSTITEEHARQLVHDAKADGAYAIVVPNDLPRATLDGLVKEALKQALPLVANSKDHRSLVRGALLGHRVLYGAPPDAFYDDVWRLLAASNTYWAPELSTLGNAELLEREPRLRNELSQPLAGGTDLGLKAAANPLRRARLLQAVREAHLAGVPLLPASGVPRPQCFAGQCLHTELWQLTEGGLTAEQTLRAATLASAEALGVEKDLGTLEPGKFGDLLVLDQNPLKDIRHSLSLKQVVLRGAVFERGRRVELPPMSTSAAKAPQTSADKQPLRAREE
jgi:Tol biopolymer transport system component